MNRATMDQTSLLPLILGGPALVAGTALVVLIHHLSVFG
jgi:hypothetical protein